MIVGFKIFLNLITSFFLGKAKLLVTRKKITGLNCLLLAIILCSTFSFAQNSEISKKKQTYDERF